VEKATEQALRLGVQDLYRHTDWKQFDFETTDDVTETTEILGQPRALSAIRFGVGMEQEGYNIYAMGSAGTGKRTLLNQFFREAARERPVPNDWCYVYGFEEAHKPQALSLPAGMGVQLQQDMQTLLEELRTALSGTFESEEYRQRRQEIQEEINNRQEQALEAIREEARGRNLMLMRTPAGLAFAPTREGEVISPEQLEEMSDEERKQLDDSIQEMQKKLQNILLEQPRLQRELRERTRQLNEEMAGLAIGGLFDELREKYGELEEVVSYLNAVQKDVIDNIDQFRADEQQDVDELPQVFQGVRTQRRESFKERYQVNVIVNNADLEGAPVIFEDNPTYQNVIGRIEYVAHLGALTTDFRLIKPGALHRANGGYLILEARTLLTQPFAWEGLKRALRSGEIRIESPREVSGVISTVTLEPEPIPLNVKVALIGDRELYYMLQQVDPDFAELFRVVADFNEVMTRDEESQQAYARLIAHFVRENKLRPFDRQAVARVIEHSSRRVGDAERLSTRVREIADLLSEANYWAGEAGHDIVREEDVQRAIDEQIYRLDRIRERSQESILRDIVLIETTGEAIGQINGLTVLQIGDFTFGRPTRITARARLGTGDVLDIEREVALAGPIHSKGMLIMQGFVGERYGVYDPLSFSANLVFEQSYGGVEGDSASVAETCALLSALGQVPLKQSLAVTGSINQHGYVQTIGGVNEKIEGFFDLCRARGLTGEQGVIIPRSNVKHLMLRQDVVEAVENGQFHVYAISTIDQALELLTGMPAGEPDEEGNYPPDTVNGRVQARLKELAERRLRFSGSLNGRRDLTMDSADE